MDEGEASEGGKGRGGGEREQWITTMRWVPSIVSPHSPINLRVNNQVRGRQGGRDD
jgi:hypothetical protein